MTAPSILACSVAVMCGTVLAVGCAEPTLRPTSVEGTRLPPGSSFLTGFLDRSSAPWRFTGTVYQHTASAPSQPLAGLPLRVSEYPGPAIRFVTSDAEGRYDLLVGDTVKVEPAPETGYLAPDAMGVICSARSHQAAARIRMPLSVYENLGIGISRCSALFLGPHVTSC
jgi:hypothetical protein